MSTVLRDLLAGPFVNMATGTQAQVLWVARPGVQGRCELLSGGEAGIEVSTNAVRGLSAMLHKAQLRGLAPGRTYRYAVTCGGDRAEGAFQTLPARGAPGPIKFVSYSDPQGSPDRHGSVAAAVRRELPFTFLSVSGDLSNDSTHWETLRSEFFQPARDLLRQTALWTARGNHEMEAVLYRDLFALPEELCYSFDAGNLHYVFLDPYRPESTQRKGPDEMAEMLAWLRRDLAAAGADWTVVTYHDPTFNVGGTGSEWGRKDLLPVLEEFGVDVVLCGHAHLYERCRPIGPAGAKPVIHITHGGGGGPDYLPAPSPLLEASYTGLHFCAFTIDGAKLEMVAKTPAGEVIDRMTLVKTGGLYQTDVMARAVDTGQAIGMAKVFKLQRASFERLPEAGAAATAVIRAHCFPAGHTVALEAASDCPWSVPKMTFQAGGEPVRLAVQPPQGVRLAATPWMGCFQPELKLRITVARGGIAISWDGVPVLIPRENLEQIHPAPRPVEVPPAPASLAVDGDLADWKDVPGLLLPSVNRPSEALRLAWRKDGLYGALSVVTHAIAVRPESPWEGSSLELNFEPDNLRRLSISKGSRAGKIVLYPPADHGQGRPAVCAPLGALFEEQDVTAAWRRTEAGYDMEFFVPAGALAPAMFQAGGTMGFDYLLHERGRVVEQFIDASRVAGAWACPFFWGRLVLGDDRGRLRLEAC